MARLGMWSDVFICTGWAILLTPFLAAAFLEYHSGLEARYAAKLSHKKAGSP